MSEFIITGKPRGGKSFIAVKMVYEVLLREKDHRPIITNLPLNLSYIAEELRKDLKLETVPDLSSRIRILDDGETSEFWLFEPGHEFTGRKSLNFRRWKMNIPDMENRGERGAWYFIDEVHIPFPAQFGQRYEGQEELEADLRWFITQHGKMNIDIVLITQHPEQINKALRRMAQEYLHVRNLSREPYLGFRIGNLFRFVRSLNSPASANPAAFDSGFHGMDFKKFGPMYDTTKGVGIVGTFIHEQPKRGRPLWILVFPLIGFVLFLFWLVVYAPHQVTSMAQSMSKGAEKKLMSAGGNIVHFNTPTKTNAEGITVPSSPPIPELHSVTAVKTNEIFCTGYTIISGSVMVFLSNGQTFTSDSGDVERVERSRVLIGGDWYKVHSREASTGKPVPVFEVKQAITAIPQSQQLPPSITVLPTVHDHFSGLQTQKISGFGQPNNAQQVMQTRQNY